MNLGNFKNLPAVLKVVLENMLRFEDGKTVHIDDIKAFSEWGINNGKNPIEIAYRPARVLLQDFTGVPAVVDLASMRDAMTSLDGSKADAVNPQCQTDLGLKCIWLWLLQTEKIPLLGSLGMRPESA